MYINSGNVNPTSVLKIKDKALDVVKNFEYLGMHIYNRLQMNKHVETLYKKARCKLGILYKIRKCISCQTSLLLYKVMIRPHLEYGDFIIDSANQVLVDNLETLQEKAIRLSEYKSRNDRTDISKLKDMFGIEKLCIRCKHSLIKIMYSQSKVDDNVQGQTDYMALRSSTKVKLKSDFTKLTKIQRSPYYRGLKLWDSLPEYMQKESCKLRFKNELSKCIC